MKKALSILSLLFLSVASVNAQIQYRQTASGLYFNIVEDVDGQTAKLGQLVSLHMTIADANGNNIQNTYQQGKPMMFPVKLSAFEGDIYEAVSLLSKGDSALFQIPADSMFIRVFKKPVPKDLPANSYLDVNIKVFDIWNQQEKLEELKAQVVSEVSTEELARRKAENVKIEAYCKSQGYEMKQTVNGVYYTYFSNGNGETVAKEGHTIVLNFTGRLLNEDQFETTYNEEGIGRPISFVLGNGEVIPGWDEVLVGKKEGDALLVVVPSHLAFGAHAKGNVIPENSPLIFNLDVMSVR